VDGVLQSRPTTPVTGRANEPVARLGALLSPAQLTQLEQLMPPGPPPPPAARPSADPARSAGRARSTATLDRGAAMKTRVDAGD
jgi:hypothetical protein